MWYFTWIPGIGVASARFTDRDNRVDRSDQAVGVPPGKLQGRRS